MNGGNFSQTFIPRNKVGLIIGKGGEQIMQLEAQSGAKIVIIQVVLISHDLL